MLCLSLRGPTVCLAKEKMLHEGREADVIELRLDLFSSYSLKELAEFKKDSSKPLIFTLRSASQGGEYSLLESERRHALMELASLLPEFLDLEWDLPLSFLESLKRCYPKVKHILSYHDFAKTATNLEEILSKMLRIPADYYKMAFMAKSSLDALSLVHFIKKQNRADLIGVSMGEKGIFTRHTSQFFNSAMSYASPSQEATTAPGQVPLKSLLKTGSSSPSFYALLGSTIHRSPSHVTHNFSMKELFLDALYLKIEILTEELREFFTLVKELRFLGFSVTMPLKQSILPFVDHLDPFAKKVQAVNTIVKEDDAWIGYNTDGIGALDAIEEKGYVRGKRILFLGSGGAARAVAHEARKRGALIAIVNRTARKAEELAEEVGGRGGGMDSLLKESNEGYDILINATPEELPLDPRYILPGTLAMEMNTLPKETSFLTKAKAKGCLLVFGYEMFIYQAAEQFALWFKQRVEKEKVRALLKESISKNFF